MTIALIAHPDCFRVINEAFLVCCSHLAPDLPDQSPGLAIDEKAHEVVLPVAMGYS